MNQTEKRALLRFFKDLYSEWVSTPTNAGFEQFLDSHLARRVDERFQEKKTSIPVEPEYVEAFLIHVRQLESDLDELKRVVAEHHSTIERQEFPGRLS